MRARLTSTKPTPGERSEHHHRRNVNPLNNGKHNEHLKSPELFSTKEFPAITFVGKEFKKGTGGTYEVKGDLTVRGTTKSITVNVEDTGRGTARDGGVAGVTARRSRSIAATRRELYAGQGHLQRRHRHGRPGRWPGWREEVMRDRLRALGRSELFERVL